MLTAASATLWQRTAAQGGLASRFVADAQVRLPLDALGSGTSLGAPARVFAGQSVMLSTTTQMATVCALLELDGLARRIVLCPPGMTPDQLSQAAREADVTVVVRDAAGAAGLPDAAGAAVVPDAAVTVVVRDAAGAAGQLPRQVRCLAPGTRPRPAGRPRHPQCETEWVLFTSGSTGAPKLVLHRLASLLAAIPSGPPGAATVFSTFYDVRRYGGLQILLRALVGGGSMVLSSPDEAPAAFLTRAGQAGIGFLSGTPTHWRRALLTPQAALIRPRDVRLSGEVADQAILDALRAAYPGARICHAFASTEAGVGFAVADGLAGFPADWLGQTRGDVELCAAGGTLRLRSPGTATRYLGQAAPALRQPDGFVDTHDAIETAGGRARFAGRRDGVINVGGQKVHPEEVEAAVNRHPGVAMSQARAKASRITGAIVVVDVVLREDAAGQPGAAPREVESDILRTCRAILAAYKVPAAVRFVPELGVGTSGKLIRSHA